MKIEGLAPVSPSAREGVQVLRAVESEAAGEDRRSGPGLAPVSRSPGPPEYAMYSGRDAVQVPTV